MQERRDSEGGARRQSPPRPASVIVAIPTRNRARLLRQTLLSVLDQSLAGVEIVVCDNASTDDTAAVVAAFADDGVRYFRNDHDIGATANQNRCLGLGHAPLLTILHDDDVLLPGSLAARTAILERHPEVGLVHSAFEVIGPAGDHLETTTWADTPTDPIENGPLFVQRSMSRGCRIAISTVMMRRAVVAGLGFDDRFGTARDLALWLQLAERASVAYLPAPTIGLRVHAGSLTAQGTTYTGQAYEETPEQAALVRDTCLQFLADSPLGRDSRLRRLARRRCGQVLADQVRRATLPERAPGETWKLLAEAARVEPTLWLSPPAWRLLAASAVTERGRQVARRLRRRSLVVPAGD